MAYRALYREWRPRDFSHMVGQQAIIETLRNQVISRRIAHAYLFCGSRGTGKTSTAKILARAINCLHPHDGDPCGECENCLRMDREETMDVIEIDAASNNGVDEMRELRDTVKYPPQYGQYKVYIIDEVHMLSTSAFNALLKTLEEPPAHIVFILATTEPQKLPATILSRCQRFDFGRLSVPEITGRLREAADGAGAQASDGALMLIARAAEGGMRDALSILDMCLGYRNEVDEELVRSILGTSDRGFLFRFCDCFAQGDAARAFTMIDDLMRDGRDPAVFAREVCQQIRSLLIAKVSPQELEKVLDIPPEEARELREASEAFTLSRLMGVLDLFLALETEMRYASTPRLSLENASLKACLRLQETDSQALQDRLTELERKMDSLQEKLARQPLTMPTALAAGQTGADQPDASGAKAPVRNKRAENASPQGIQEGTLKEAPAKPAASDTEAWQELMNRFKKTEVYIWSMLTQGNLVAGQNGEFCWQAAQDAGEKIYVENLNQPEKQQKISQTLSEITGRTCTFRASERNRKQTAAAAANDDEAYLQTLYETFGAAPVSVVD